MSRRMNGVAVLLILILNVNYDVNSQQTTDNQLELMRSSAENRTCHEGLNNSQQLVINIESTNFGCLVKCTVLESSSEQYSGFFDQTNVMTHRLSNTNCNTPHHICLNGSCILNPLISPIATTTMSLYKMFGSSLVKIHSGFVHHDDALSRGDIFIKLYINDRFIGQTQTHHSTYRPRFNEEFPVRSLSRLDILKFEIWDQDPGTNEYLGSFSTTCDEILVKRMNNKMRSHFSGDHRILVTIKCENFNQ